MVESVVIMCEESPFGKNSVVESIRMAAGILAVGDVEDVKVIILKNGFSSILFFVFPSFSFFNNPINLFKG